MRSLLYTVSIYNIPVFETFSYAEAEAKKAEGFQVTTRFIERRTPKSKKEKERLKRRFEKLPY